MLRKIFCLLTAAAMLICNAQALTRDEVRALWQDLSAQFGDDSPYQTPPDPQNFVSGALSDAAQRDALNVLNFLRTLAGLQAVQLNSLYSLRAQNGALLLAANDELTHHPLQPEGMQDDLYQSGLTGTEQGNIAKFNWMRPQILVDGVTYFARDDGPANLENLGHRRWLLNPTMAETGFGLANSLSGMSYVTMYAVDQGNADASWTHVAWPSDGAFPVELMRSALAWSISVNEEFYDLDASHPTIVLREENSGATFSFDPLLESGDGYCTLSRQAYGSGSCLIFRPDLKGAGIEEYVQNQLWTVEVRGLIQRDGQAAELDYCCEMISLYVQEVANVEMNLWEANLAPGEKLQLEAQVVPTYADNRFVRWISSNPDVADVDEKGLVTAVGPGTCEITATSENGRWDGCTVTVK